MQASWRHRTRALVLGFVAASLTLAAYGAGRTAPGAARPGADDDDTSSAAAAPVSATTQLDYNRAVDAFQQQIADTYEKTSQDPPELRRRVVAWIRSIGRADADLGDAPTWDEIYQQGEALLEAGCEHPLVVNYAAQFDMLRGRLQRSVERSEQSSDPLLAGEYGPLARYHAAVRLMRLGFLNARQQRFVTEQQAGEAWLELAASEPDPMRQRILWSYLKYLTGNAWNRPGAVELVERAADDERLHGWLRAMAAGKAAYDKAWRLRGGGYSSEVDDDKWQGFFEAVAEAKKHFSTAYDLEPDHPEAAGELVAVANCEDDADTETVRHWFDEARAAQVDYFPAYEHLLWAMKPQWRGNLGVMYGLAQEWYAEGAYDTNAPWMAAKAVFDIGRMTGGWDKPLQSEGPYTLVMSALQAMADDPGHDASVRRDFTRAVLLTHVIAAAICGDHEDEALTALQTLSDEGLTVDADTLRGYELQPELHVPRLYARRGKAAEQVAALALLTDEDKRANRAALVRTVAAYEEAKRQTDDPRADAYFDHWIRVYSMERDFHDGEWATPVFDPTFNDWYRPVEGLWEVESPTSAVSRQSDVSGAPHLWTPCLLGDCYEVEFDIEPLYETGKSAWNGVKIGGEEKSYYFWLNQSLSGVAVTESTDCAMVYPVAPKSRYRIGVRVWPGYGEMWVDGAKRFEQELEEFEPSGYFALASVPRTGHGAEVRYSNIRFRRLAPRESSGETQPDADSE